MSEFLFDQLEFARTGTLNALEGVSESKAKKVHAGLNNNILWNLGHLYMSLERFAFHYASEPLQIPEGFAKFFGGGTKPADWVGEPPSLVEVVDLLKAQPNRVRDKLQGRLNQPVAEPVAIRSLSFKTLAETLSFSLLHEGMHNQNIKVIRRLVEQE